MKYKFTRVSLVDFITVLCELYRKFFKNYVLIKTPVSIN